MTNLAGIVSLFFIAAALLTSCDPKQSENHTLILPSDG